MAGWNLKSGSLVESQVSDDEYWSLFNYVFSDACKKTNTYKFGLIKSICDQIYELSCVSDAYFLSYEQVFSKFAENYWNLVNRYKLKQMHYNGSADSKIETILREAVEASKVPDLVPFEQLSQDERTSIIRRVAKECKRCVVGALYENFEGKLYSFDLKGEGIFLSIYAYQFISKYKLEIEHLNYYAWARFLEKVNDDDALVRVLEKLDLSTPQRNDLSIYRQILFKEFQEDTCFYCGKKLTRNIHVDHFIPWSFMKSDNLWNFVIACQSCNLKKSGGLVGIGFVSQIEQRNQQLLNYSFTQPYDRFIDKEFSSYNEGLIRRIWTYARMSGIREKHNLV